MISFGSVCSGIEAASVAFRPLGWNAAWLAEIEAFPCAVLAHHYPQVPNYGDMTQLPALVALGEVEPPEVLCGGTPCQAFSVAGLRKSLEDSRGNLTLTFVELANAIDEARERNSERPCVILWENVPGVLNTKDNAFGSFLAGLAGEELPLVPPGKRWENAGLVLGPKRAVAWRVLDAQHFGLAQRRKRVFVVASAGAVSPAEILFEFDGLRRDSAPSRGAREEATPGAGASIATSGSHVGIVGAICARGSKGAGSQHDSEGKLAIVRQPFEIANTRTARMHKGINTTVDEGQTSVIVHPSQDPPPGHSAHASAEGRQAFGIPGNWIGRKPANGGNSTQFLPETASALTAADRHGVVTVVHGTQDPIVSVELAQPVGRNRGQESTVAPPPGGLARRLTPTECERLMGFPDGYTKVPWRGKPAEDCPDGLRYKALGNSWAVPVARWIGKRIAQALRQEIYKI